MEDFIFTPIVVAIGLAIHFLVLRRSTSQEGNLLTLAFGAHVIAALAQVWLVLYYFPGGGDMLGYFRSGLTGSAALASDFGRFAPEVVRAFFQLEYHLPVELFGEESTLSMSAASSFFLYVFGDSFYAATMFVAMLAYSSQYLIYAALRSYFRPDQHRLVLIGTCLIPSGVFWSSCLLKEPLVMIAIGPLVLGLHWFASGTKRVLALLLILSSVAVLTMLKPYVLMALSLAAGVFYLWRRMQSREDVQLKPFALISAFVIAAVGLFIGSRYFSKGDVQDTAGAFAAQRRSGYEMEGGSNYFLDDPTTEGAPTEDRSLQHELALAPIGLATALFRPLLFEARNAVQFANSLEATVLLILVIQGFRRIGLRRFVAEIAGSPALLFCVVFTLALGVGTGLASTNLGTLSRYRAPMMPFYFTVVLMLRFGIKQEGARQSPVRSFLHAAVPERLP